MMDDAERGLVIGIGLGVLSWALIGLCAWAVRVL